jgi:predicted ArsR family transcriptional regulator
MSGLIKDFIEIKDCASLDELIAQLTEVRNSLPEEARHQVKMRGDDIFGRHICVSYYRPQTADETECDARYADAYRQSRERELTRLQDELGFCPVSQPRRRLRIVA